MWKEIATAWFNVSSYNLKWGTEENTETSVQSTCVCNAARAPRHCGSHRRRFHWRWAVLLPYVCLM